MGDRIAAGGLEVAPPLHRFVRDEALPGTGIEEEAFWSGFASILRDLGPRREELLAERERLQRALDAWHTAHPGPVDVVAYERVLRDLGYLVDEPDDFTITTAGVDAEVATVAGPQLVVPLLNARFAVNAANARWGSLYDALYGTDAIPSTGAPAPAAAAYDPVRGAEVVRRGRAFLDEHFPLATGSHADARGYSVDRGTLTVRLTGGATTLGDPGAFVGHRGAPGTPESVLLVHHGLHVELVLDREGTIGRDDPAGVQDLVLEAALTTIMDLEDSVAAVDVDDKVLGYRNWLGLNAGTLTAEVTKGGRTSTRRLAPDRVWTGADGAEVVRPGRSLLWVRQVGHLMTTDAVLLDGLEVSEGFLDAVMTGLGSLAGTTGTGSTYVVKPKLHGPDEVALTDTLLARVEDLLGLARGTIKLGIMDEERRTSVNLKACIRAAAGRVAFVNTGFLDRTGDEIHTSMLAGAMVAKERMRDAQWIAAYEDQNVDVALACGFRGRAQVGKGMWARPDDMAAMLEAKVAHPAAGASCAWVPSPTAATLHALHYHRVDVATVQRGLEGGHRTRLAQLLAIPLAEAPPAADGPAEGRLEELENNLQGVLGYVKRWVDDGVGCSKVPDIHGTALMEDRATCRISSQHVANWWHHGVVTLDEVESALRRMADVVDQQQAAPGYVAMGPAYDGHAFLAARDLVLQGLAQPSGYTEPVLHRRRRLQKALTDGAPA